MQLQFIVKCKINIKLLGSNLKSSLCKAVYDVPKALLFDDDNNEYSITFGLNAHRLDHMLLQVLEKNVLNKYVGHLSITDVYISADNEIVFNVNIEVDFATYTPSVLNNLIFEYDGVVTKMSVKNDVKEKRIYPTYGTHIMTINISPMHKQFHNILNTLECDDTFDLSIALGASIVMPPHNLNYIKATARFRDPYRGRVVIALADMTESTWDNNHKPITFG